MVGRNTSGTVVDVQSTDYCPRLRGSHSLTNRLSVTSWHSLASSWQTNRACSKEPVISQRATKALITSTVRQKDSDLNIYPHTYKSASYIASCYRSFHSKHANIHTNTPIRTQCITSQHTETHEYTHPVLHLPMCSPLPPSDRPARVSAEPSWWAADGTGSLL